MNEESNDEAISESARNLGRRGASRGGKARAKRLTAAQRSEIARDAAAARWGSEAAPVSHDGSIKIGEAEIKCAVTLDGVRLINQETFLTALGRAPKAKGGTGVRSSAVPAVLSANNLAPYISDELKRMSEPILYLPRTGGRAYGYRAEILPAVCEVYLEARSDNVIRPNQQAAAQAAEVLVRGLARVGIIALVDEATGYQESRARHELQKILEAYVSAELRPWTKVFPDEFFEQVYRLQGWDYRPGTAKRTPYVGKLINHYVYEQLPPGVLEELRERNPRRKGRGRAHKHHQLLTGDTGSPHLDRQIATVTTLMRISGDKSEFEALFEKAYPPPQARLPLIIDVDETD